MLLMRQSVVSFSLFAQAATHLNASPFPWLLVFVCVCVCVQLLSYNHNFIKHIFTKAFSTLNCIVITTKALAGEAKGLDIPGVLQKGGQVGLMYCHHQHHHNRGRKDPPYDAHISLLRQRQGAKG